VVVKRLKEVAAGKKEFEQQMEVIGRVGQHPNIVPLRAYYYSKDEKLLVHNYMSAGSLSAFLHGKLSFSSIIMNKFCFPFLHIFFALLPSPGIRNLCKADQNFLLVIFIQGNFSPSKDCLRTSKTNVH
jgi:serine/threonine protein kinase